MERDIAVKNHINTVSIIIPVYNTPKTIFFRTIKTIKEQSYRKIEIFLVDDDSNKETGEMLDECVAELVSQGLDSTVVHIKSGGVSNARNTGIELSKGDWVCFVDSDDLIDKYYVESMLAVALQFNAPVACCNLKKIKTTREVEESKVLPTQYKVYEGENVWKYVNTSYCVNKLYRRDVLAEIRFDTDMSLAEDFLFSNQIFERYTKVAHVDKVLYWYLLNPLSSTSFLSAKQCHQGINAYEYGLNISYIKNNPQLYAGRLSGLIAWYLRFCEALVGEKPHGYRQECKEIKSHILSLGKSINTNNFAIYEKILYWGFVKMPFVMGVITLKMMRIIRRVRFKLRKIKINNYKEP